MSERTKKRWGTAITDETKLTVEKWLDGEIGIQEFIDQTGTTQSSCYSIIARACREMRSKLSTASK